MLKPGRDWIVPVATLAALLLTGCGAAQPAAPSQGTAPKASAASSAERSAGASAGGQGLPASGRPASAAPLKKAILADPSASLTAFSSQVAKDQGFFGAEGVDVTVMQMATPAAMAALQAGEIQFTSATGTTVRSALQGLGVRVIAHLQTEPFSLVTRPEITTIAQLKGQKVGFGSVGGDDQVYTLAALKTAQLAASDVELLMVGNNEKVAQAMLGGQIAGGALAPPATQELARQGYHIQTQPDLLDMPSGGLGTSLQVLKNDPQLVRSVLAGMLDGLVWAKAHPDEATAYISKKYELEPAIAKGAYEQTISSARFSFADEQLQGVVQRALDQTKSDKKVPLSDVYDLSFLKELVQAKGLK
jgi:NitT/TauT family transport system substrate-binding protein